MKNEECRMKKIKLKYLFQKLSNGFWGNEEENDENDIVCIRVADFIFQNGKISTDNLTIRNIPSLNKEDILLKGDILLEKSGGGEKTPVGRCVLFDLNIKAVCSNFITRLKIDDKHYPKYVHYLLTYLYLIGETNKHIKQTTGIQNLDVSSFLNSSFFIPPLSEQTAIANFLDDKTAKIDSLIEKKKKLIELYKEERTAVINQAVTRGINPNVKLKPSGIDWLGDIPEHWEVKKLKYDLNIKSGDGIKSEEIYFEGTYPVYGGNGIMGYTENFNSDKLDIIIGRVGAKCGNVRLVDGKKWISDNALVAKVFEGFDHKFISILLESINLNSLANQNAQPLITGTLVREKVVCVPQKIEEQQQIVEYIEAETKRIDEKIKRTEKEIELLQEYRTALISEVVTGKIKV